MATNTSFSPKAGFAAIARGLSRASGTQVDDEALKAIVVFCGIGLVVSLLMATNGLDMSIGFF
jgi:hypothetical protein